MFGLALDVERAFDRITGVSRTRVRRRRLTVILVAAMVAGVWAGPVAAALGRGEAARPVSRSTYLVRTGDTLWSIAERVAPHQDPRAVVDAISEANRVDAGALMPGRILAIPAIG
jgi:Tfp pilus assembly protein FimV